MKLPVAPNNGDRILGLYLQLKLFRKSRDVTIAVSYIISALISCNFIIKNYVNRKITERESVRRIFLCNYRLGLPLSTHRPVTSKNTGKYDSIGDKNRKKACVRIKRVKTDNYLTYGQSRKTWNYTYPLNTNKLLCLMKM